MIKLKSILLWHKPVSENENRIYLISHWIHPLANTWYLIVKAYQNITGLFYARELLAAFRQALQLQVIQGTADSGNVFTTRQTALAAQGHFQWVYVNERLYSK